MKREASVSNIDLNLPPVSNTKPDRVQKSFLHRANQKKRPDFVSLKAYCTTAIAAKNSVIGS